MLQRIWDFVDEFTELIMDNNEMQEVKLNSATYMFNKCYLYLLTSKNI